MTRYIGIVSAAMELMGMLFIAVTLLAQDKAPAISADLQASFERARANEQDSAKVHDADATKLRDVVAEIQKACGEKYDIQRPERDGPLICVAKPGPEAKN